jgi:large subunit ribosomal protein L17
MLRNMACNLFLQEASEDTARRITTTVPKAKEARRIVERAITLGKRGTLHARRQALALLRSKSAVKTVFEEIAPLYNDRPGGYTRILRLAQSRRGDGADLCYFELVAEPLEAKPSTQEPVAPRRVTEEPEADEVETVEDEAADQDEEPEDQELSGDEETKPETE